MIREVLVPQINPNDPEAEVVHWYVKNGERIEQGQKLVDLETSKAVFTVEAETGGFFKQAVALKEKTLTGACLGWIADTAEVLPADTKELSIPPNENPTRFSKAAQSYLKEFPETLLNQAKGLVTLRQLRSEKTSIPKTKQSEIKALSESGGFKSSVSVQIQAETLYKKLREQKLYQGSCLPLLLHAFAKAAEAEPLLNAKFSNGEIQIEKQIHLGLALDLDLGLKVATLRDANHKTADELSFLITTLTLKYLRNELSLEEVTGSTVTVTDLSAWKIVSFEPLLSHGQSAVLGIGGDSSLPGQPLTLTLGFDHRVLSGRQAAQALSQIRETLLGFIKFNAPS